MAIKRPSSTFVPSVSASASTHVIWPTISVPLTTIFTPPADCSGSWHGWVSTKGGSQLFFAETTGGSSCFPPKWESLTSAFMNTIHHTAGVYSPGVCPSGYRNLFQQSIFSTDSAGITQTALGQICCPSYCPTLTFWTMGVNDTQTACGGVVTSHVTMPYSTGTAKASTTTRDAFYVLNIPYTVIWASSDLNTFTPISAPLSGPTSGSNSSSSSLSTGAKAGIGVGVAIAALAMIILLAWYLLARRKRRAEGRTTLHSRDGKDAWELPAHGDPKEAHGDVKFTHELSPTKDPQEVDAPERYELDGSYKGQELTDIATPVEPPVGYDDKWRDAR